jgi:hypothetical protein
MEEGRLGAFLGPMVGAALKAGGENYEGILLISAISPARADG